MLFKPKTMAFLLLSFAFLHTSLVFSTCPVTFNSKYQRKNCKSLDRDCYLKMGLRSGKLAEKLLDLAEEHHGSDIALDCLEQARIAAQNQANCSFLFSDYFHKTCKMINWRFLNSYLTELTTGVKMKQINLILSAVALTLALANCGFNSSQGNQESSIDGLNEKSRCDTLTTVVYRLKTVKKKCINLEVFPNPNNRRKYFLTKSTTSCSNRSDITSFWLVAENGFKNVRFPNVIIRPQSGTRVEKTQLILSQAAAYGALGEHVREQCHKR